jgi:ribulose-phosphate 3-epimerase
MVQVYPSLIASNSVNLEATIKELEPFCAGFHIDVMDYHFVPNLTLGPDFVNAIRKVAKKRLWVHLMAEDPKKYIDRMHLYHGDIVSVHYETVDNHMLEKISRELHGRKLQLSLALNPKTAVEVVKPYFHKNMIDQILLMSVEPGFSGQHFLPESYHKLQVLNDLREEYTQSFAIGMDGGINAENLPELIKNGINDVAIASGIFGSDKSVEKLKQLSELAKVAGK